MDTLTKGTAGAAAHAAVTAVALFGATGYTGRESARLLLTHPALRLAAAFGGRDREGAPLAAIHASLRGLPEVVCAGLGEDDSALAGAADLLRDRGVTCALLATPEATSMRLAPRLLEAGVRVVDLSGAFRLRSASDYPAWFGLEHTAPALLSRAVYGLTEWNRAAIAAADLVANPGCFPTATLLGLLPLRRADLIDPSAGVVVNAVSGASGAGRRLRDDLLFCEVEGGIRPYGVPRHRHLAEIAATAGLQPGMEIVFTPHLAPFDRGLLASIALKLRDSVGASAVATALGDAYADAPSIRLLGEGGLPSTADVRGTNLCVIGWSVDAAARRATVFAAIDNLMKGAAGSAVQNLNLMLGRPETEGLPR